MGWDFVDTQWWRAVVDVATVAAGLLAAWAIRQAGKARREASELVARERRLDFELDVLLELLDHLNALEQPQYVTRLRTLPADEVRVCRWATGLDQDWPAAMGPAPVDQQPEVIQRRRPEWGWHSDDGSFRRVPVILLEELLAAVQRRLDER